MDSGEPRYSRVPVRQLEISPLNVRHREINTDIEDLARSMEAYGLQQPIVVQPKGEKYEILIGQRRFLAAKQLGWNLIDAKILPRPLTDLDAVVASFSENAQRRDLSARDKADACAYLLEQLGSVREVARHLGVSETTVRKWLGYAAVPESIKVMVAEGRISRPAATRIAEHVADEASALAIAERLATIRPTPPQRQRILDAVEEFSDRSVDVIFDKAEQLRTTKEIIFVLPERWQAALDQASRELERDANELAREATIDWLAEYLATGGRG